MKNSINHKGLSRLNNRGDEQFVSGLFMDVVAARDLPSRADTDLQG
jgi:hypothetical protein